MLRYDDIQKPSEWEKEKAKSKAPGYMIYFLLIGLVMLMLKVRETKGVDMGVVAGQE